MFAGSLISRMTVVEMMSVGLNFLCGGSNGDVSVGVVLDSVSFVDWDLSCLVNWHLRGDGVIEVLSRGGWDLLG